MIERKDKEPVEPEMTPTTPEVAEGVRRQREHIEDLDGEDPLRGGVAD